MKQDALRSFGGEGQTALAIFIPTTRTPAEQDIQRLASRMGAALPKAYLRFVEAHDGAVPESNSFAVGDDNKSGVRQFVSVADAVSMTDAVAGFPSGMIAIAEDGCGNLVYLDPRTEEILFWDHEIEGPDQWLAIDMDAFLRLLKPFDKSAIELKPGQVRSAWIDSDFLEKMKRLGDA